MEDKFLEDILIFDADQKAESLAKEKTVAYWEPPYEVKTENEEGNSSSMLFPYGLKVFADKYNADVIYVEDGNVTYYSEGNWKVLDDSKPSTPTNLRMLPK